MPHKKGLPTWNKGLRGISSHSIETRKKISETNKKNGVGKWMIGRHLTEETKIKQSDALKGNRCRLWIDGRSYDVSHVNAVKLRGKIRLQEKRAGRKKPEACELCGDKVKICFDHDHATGRFRGWICHRCNLAIAFAKDNAELLTKMATYLKKYE